MPLWRIYHPDNVWTDNETKKAIVDAITGIYTGVGLPAFYVDVLFIPLPSGSVWRGGEIQPSDTRPPFIRIVFTNVARRMPPGRSTRKLWFMNTINEVLDPFIAKKGWDWEIHGEESDLTLARIQGQEFPLEGTESFKRWLTENVPTPHNEPSEG